MNSLPPDLERRFKRVAEQTGYPVDALFFTIGGISRTDSMPTEVLHIDATELCWRLHNQALARFGSSARAQLASWGITSTNDFGLIVFGLISEGLMLQDDDDKLEDFHNVFVFDEEFNAFRYPPSPRLFQWRLSTLFLITTIAAIALPGALSGGFSGAFGTLTAAWFVIMGGFCMILGFRKRTTGWCLLIAIGAAFFAAGITAFASITANSSSN